MNELDLSNIYRYNGTYISDENATASAWWKSATGWYLANGPYITWGPNQLPATNDYAKSSAAFQNYYFPGGPYLNSLDVYGYVYGNGNVSAGYFFSFSNLPWWWQYWGSYSRTQISNGGYPPFYRFFNNRDHFYTENWAEGAGAGYNYEGVAGYLGLSNEGGTAPFYRSLNSANGDHFYSKSWAEVHTHGYSYDGVAGYIR